MLLGELHNFVYSRFPTVQWGSLTAPNANTMQWTAANFPIEFPTACCAIVSGIAAPVGYGNNSAAGVPTTVKDISQAGFMWAITGTSVANWRCFYVAVGY